ncbi:MAPEG family protein [Vibrio palustris]|uniref:Microsomal glutathione S-transferase 1 n=1 Tax=Vibrio palustris TaxID=1918946 RepID=A0A1R4B506_9VIBR|nr:MAPEG family protein [Vibrio palustris]SJL83997.1 MAPEG family protein [Vibrio palustris]
MNTLLNDYHTSLLGLWVVLATWIVQWAVATMAKGAQKDAVPGKIDNDLSHDSFIFRSHRTFMNSLENVPVMLGLSLLAILAGANPYWCGIWICVFAVARLFHMGLYYAIATEKNPSPRSYFFLVGVVAMIAMLVLTGSTLI